MTNQYGVTLIYPLPAMQHYFLPYDGQFSKAEEDQIHPMLVAIEHER